MPFQIDSDLCEWYILEILNIKYIIHRDLNQFETAFTKCQVCVTHFYILAFFGYLLKTDHFFWRETFPYPNFNSFMHAEWPNWHPSKSFLVVIDKNNARMLIRLCRRTQNALNGLKIQPTDLELFLDCQIIFIWLSVSLKL